MRVNVCINGTFRYPGYIRHYAEAGALNRYYYSHRIGTNAETLGISADQARNIWFKEYALHGALRIIRPKTEQDLMVFFGDMFQRAVISNWDDCDSVEAVIGQVADKILRHAKNRGAATVGHPVNSHPALFTQILNEEHERLGLRWPELKFSDRRKTEISDCDRIVADSNFVAKSFIENGYPADRISIVRPGGDTKRFSARGPQDLDRQVFRVVSVGALSPRKGHRYLLEAWKLLNLRNAELVIIGASSEAKQAICRGYNGLFTHHEHFPNSELRGILTSASAFVLPSIEDGFSQAPIEALSCGVPAIVTQNNGVADVIRNGVNGYVVAARSAHAIAEKLQILYDDRQHAEELGRNAASMAEQTLDWGPYVARVLEVHREAIAQARSVS